MSPPLFPRAFEHWPEKALEHLGFYRVKRAGSIISQPWGRREKEQQTYNFPKSTAGKHTHTARLQLPELIKRQNSGNFCIAA